MKPLFTIITVCYNSEKTIVRTIESILYQNYEDYEYIIVDGNSKDNTLEIINKYKNKFKGKLIVISEPDNGIYNAMNKGINVANGEWINFLNSDDWFEPNVFSKVEKAIFENKNADCIYGDVRKILNFNNKFYSKIERAKTNLKELEKGMIFSHQSLFVRKSVFEKIGGFDETFKIAADWDFILRMYTRNMKFIYIPEIIANFTIGGIGSTPHIRERHKVRKKNGVVNGIDIYYLKEIRHYIKNLIINRFFINYSLKRKLDGFEPMDFG